MWYFFTNSYFCSNMSHLCPNTLPDIALIKGFLGALLEAPAHHTLQKLKASLSIDSVLLDDTFYQWAGVPMAQFLTFLTPQYAQQRCASTTSLPNDASKMQLLRCEASDLDGELIVYKSYTMALGTMVVGASLEGLCYAAFSNYLPEDVAAMQRLWPRAILQEGCNALHVSALQYIANPASSAPTLPLWVSCTDFQWRVWQQLLQIPSGGLLNYGQLAERLQLPNGARAVGTAIGCNPLAYFIPCHRVVQASGKLGGFRWGLAQKQLLIGFEAAQNAAVARHKSKL